MNRTRRFRPIRRLASILAQATALLAATATAPAAIAVLPPPEPGGTAGVPPAGSRS